MQSVGTVSKAFVRRRHPRLAQAPPRAYLPRETLVLSSRSRTRSLPIPNSLRSPWIAPAALAVAVLSLAANAWLIAQLRAPERAAAPAIDRVLTRLAEQDARFKYEIRVPAGTPLHFDVPIDERYTVKLRTTLPINTDVKLPINTPFGRRTVTVPVRTNIPIRQDVPFHVVDTFRLRTQTRTEYVVPLEVRVRDLPLDEIRKSLDP